MVTIAIQNKDMKIEKQEEAKKEEEQTSTQDASTEEKNDSAQGEDTPKTNEGEEQTEITLSKDEYEKLKKKSTDFDGLIEKRRLEKLAKIEDRTEDEDEEKPKVDDADIDALVAKKVQEAISQVSKPTYENNLKDAYGEFIKNNPWADDDEVISKISKNFDGKGDISKDNLVAKMERLAQENFPTQYRKSLEDNIRKTILAEQSNIEIGDGGGSDSPKKDAASDSVKLTKEQVEMAKRCGNDPVKVYNN